VSPEGAPAPDEGVFSDEEIEAARVLFARPAVFLMGAVSVEGLPAPDLPEVAFAGRSNVGKSSLINGLVGQKHLARASNEPGRTREVNFFVVDDRLRLVDLPGYGWARAAKGEVKKFQALGRDYLRGRPNLRRAYLLIDARHGRQAQARRGRGRARPHRGAGRQAARRLPGGHRHLLGKGDRPAGTARRHRRGLRHRRLA
jgi:GTP-binding protein